jgi:hypothetical protein
MVLFLDKARVNMRQKEESSSTIDTVVIRSNNRVGFEPGIIPLDSQRAESRDCVGQSSEGKPFCQRKKGGFAMRFPAGRIPALPRRCAGNTSNWRNVTPLWHTLVPRQVIHLHKKQLRGVRRVLAL